MTTERSGWVRSLLECVLALLVFTGIAVALTWPAVDPDAGVILGGGELGGWLWRQWWHFQEIEALGETDLGWIEWFTALIGLGRYPETGNILDIILLSYPLEKLFGFPYHHNVKVLVILVGNGLCAYALARSLTDSRLVALAAGALALVNPLVIQDINKTGLRQTLLWWLLLYPLTLDRAERTGRARDGVLAGATLGMVAAFYWFYGLFAGMYSVIRIGAYLWGVRGRWGDSIRWLSGWAVATAVVAGLFLLPYTSSGKDQDARGGTSQLPELTFFLPYPSYDTVSSAPLRPTNYRENVLSSIHRTIDSAWPVDYVFNPGHGVLAFPAAAFVLGVLPAFFIRRARVWLCVWLVFFAGTLGPYLKWGAQKDTSDVVMLGEYVVRLPYALMFQFIPGMSRMFAPYRMASLVVVASVALLAISLHGLGRVRVRGRQRVWLRPGVALLALGAIVLQPFRRFDLGPVNQSALPSMWRIPTQVSAFRLPQWYAQLDPDGWEGLIELPLEQQQDLLCAYQSFHRRKVYRSWATEPALPPTLRVEAGADAESLDGSVANRLQWLARPEPNRDPTEDIFRALSRTPLEAETSAIQDGDLSHLLEVGGYRWLVVHERGFYLLKPREGGIYYRHVVRMLSERLGITPEESTEIETFEWPGKRRHFPVGPAWVPWASQEVQLPTPSMPTRYSMAVFDLAIWSLRQ